MIARIVKRSTVEHPKRWIIMMMISFVGRPINKIPGRFKPRQSRFPIVDKQLAFHSIIESIGHRIRRWTVSTTNGAQISRYRLVACLVVVQQCDLVLLTNTREFRLPFTRGVRNVDVFTLFSRRRCLVCLLGYI